MIPGSRDKAGDKAFPVIDPKRLTNRECWVRGMQHEVAASPLFLARPICVKKGRVSTYLRAPLSVVESFASYIRRTPLQRALWLSGTRGYA
jgi:hypothetical protein